LSLRLAALEIARTYVGVHETPGKRNEGPEVNLFLAATGLNPGYPWCCSWAFFVCEKAAAKLGLRNPFPRTASVLRAWRTGEPVMRLSNPVVGAWWFLRHSETTGHCGVVEAIDDFGVITSISANTNEKGSREGTHILRKAGQPEAVHGGELQGYWDLDAAAQQPLVS
jgi:hypothetical protein